MARLMFLAFWMVFPPALLATVEGGTPVLVHDDSFLSGLAGQSVSFPPPSFGLPLTVGFGGNAAFQTRKNKKEVKITNETLGKPRRPVRSSSRARGKGSKYLYDFASAIKQGSLSSVRMYLDLGVPLESHRFIYSDIRAVSPLHYLAEYEHLEIARELIRAGAPLNTLDEMGNTPLMLAAKHRNQGMIRELVLGGAHVELKDKYGDLPMFYTIKNDDLESLKVLIKANAGIHLTDRWGNNPLIMAVEKGHLEMVQLLLEKGARLDQANAKGKKVVDIAVANNDLEVLKLLGARGAEIPESHRKPLLLDGVAIGHLETVRNLLKSGGQVDARDENGDTLLIIAAKRGDLEMVQLLVAYGADVYLKGSRGYSAYVEVWGKDARKIKKVLASKFKRDFQ